MSTKNLLVASLFLAACTSSLLAQSIAVAPDTRGVTPSTSATPQDNLSHVPALTNSQITVFDPQAIPAGVNPKDVEIAMAGLEKMRSKLLVLPQNKNSLCFAIRSSEFTAEDLKSSVPHASSHSTCVPAASSRMKSAVVVLVK